MERSWFSLQTQIVPVILSKIKKVDRLVCFFFLSYFYKVRNNATPRERILETACRLFYEQGYNSTGINQILEEARVAKASLYLHYGSKEELGIEYLKKIREDWFLAFEAHLSGKKEPEEKILSAFDFLEMNMKLNQFRGCRFLNLLSDIDSTNPVMEKHILEHKSKLREFFKMVTGKIISGKENLLMTEPGDIIYLLFEAAIIESKVYKDVWPITTAKKSVKNIIKLVS